MKCYKITPSDDSNYDDCIIVAGETWKPALDAIESVLESLFLRMEDDGGKWEDIKVKIECVEMTDDEMAEMQNDFLDHS